MASSALEFTATVQSTMSGTTLKRSAVEEPCLAIDPWFAEPETVQRIVHRLDSCRQVMEKSSRSKEYHLIYNACVTVMDLSKVLLGNGMPHVAVPYVGFAIMMTEATISLASVRYLSFRVRLYGIMSRCLSAAGHVTHSRKCLERCLQKIDWLDKLEHSDRIPPPPETDRSLARAREDVKRYMSEETAKKERAIEIAFREKSVDKLKSFGSSTLVDLLVSAVGNMTYVDALGAKETVDVAQEPKEKMGEILAFAEQLCMASTVLGQSKGRLCSELALHLYKNFAKKAYTSYVQKRDLLYKQHGNVDRVAGQEIVTSVLHNIARALISSRCLDYILCGQIMMQSCAMLIENKESSIASKLLISTASFLSDARARLSQKRFIQDRVRTRMLYALQADCVEMTNFVHMYCLGKSVQNMDGIHKSDAFALQMARAMSTGKYPLSVDFWQSNIPLEFAKRAVSKRFLRIYIPLRFVANLTIHTLFVYWKKMPTVISVYDVFQTVDMDQLRQSFAGNYSEAYVDVFDRLQENGEYAFAFRSDQERDLGKAEGTLFTVDPVHPFAWEFSALRRITGVLSYQFSEDKTAQNKGKWASLLTWALDASVMIDAPLMTLEIASKVYQSFIPLLVGRQKPPALFKPFLSLFVVLANQLPNWAKYRPDSQRFIAKVTYELLSFAEQNNETVLLKDGVLEPFLKYSKVPTAFVKQREIDRLLTVYSPENVKGDLAGDSVLAAAIELSALFRRKQFADVLKKVVAVSKLVQQVFAKFSEENKVDIPPRIDSTDASVLTEQAKKVIFCALKIARKRRALRKARSDFVQDELPWRAHLELLRALSLKSIYDQIVAGAFVNIDEVANAAAPRKDAKKEAPKKGAAPEPVAEPAVDLNDAIPFLKITDATQRRECMQKEVIASIGKACELAHRSGAWMLGLDAALHCLQFGMVTKPIARTVVEIFRSHAVEAAQLGIDREFPLLFENVGDDSLTSQFNELTNNRFCIRTDAPKSEILLDKARKRASIPDYDAAIRVSREQHDMDSLISALYEVAELCLKTADAANADAVRRRSFSYFNDCLDACFARVNVLDAVSKTPSILEGKIVDPKHVSYVILSCSRFLFGTSNIDLIQAACLTACWTARKMLSHHVHTVADFARFVCVDSPPGVAILDPKSLVWGGKLIIQLSVAFGQWMDVLPLLSFCEYLSVFHLRDEKMVTLFRRWKTKVSQELDVEVVNWNKVQDFETSFLVDYAMPTGDDPLLTTEHPMQSLGCRIRRKYDDAFQCLSDQRKEDFFAAIDPLIQICKDAQYSTMHRMASLLRGYGAYFFNGQVDAELSQYMDPSAWTLLGKRSSVSTVALRPLDDIRIAFLLNRYDEVERLVGREFLQEGVQRNGYALVAALVLQGKVKEALTIDTRFLNRSAGTLAMLTNSSKEKWNLFSRSAFSGSFRASLQVQKRVENAGAGKDAKTAKPPAGKKDEKSLPAVEEPKDTEKDELSLLGPVLRLSVALNHCSKNSFHRRLLRMIFAELAFVYGTAENLRHKGRYFLLRSILHAQQEYDLLFGGKEDELSKTLTSLDSCPESVKQYLKGVGLNMDSLSVMHCFSQIYREFEIGATDYARREPVLVEMHQWLLKQNAGYASLLCSEVTPWEDRSVEIGFWASTWYVLDEADQVLAKHARGMSALELKRRESQGFVDVVQGVTILASYTHAADAGRVAQRMVALPDVQALLLAVRSWRYSFAMNGPASPLTVEKYATVANAFVDCFAAALDCEISWWTEKRIDLFETLFDAERGSVWVDTDLLILLLRCLGFSTAS
eukprot:ANDGO_03070.mRNA.1 hypothetical protein GUITHDRAFT_165079